MKNSIMTSAKFLKFLKENGFDTDKFKPIFVVFAHQTSHKYSSRNKKYLYYVPIDSEVKEGDYVVISVYEKHRFNVAKVVAIDENIYYERVPEISQLTDSFHSGQSKEVIENMRPVVSIIGDEDSGPIKEYKDLIESQKRKKEIYAQLELQSKEAEKMFMYKELAKTDEKMKSLLNELEEL